MSTGSSAIDPMEFNEVRPMSEELNEDERRGGSRSRRRQSRADIRRPHINVVRREAQDLYSQGRHRLLNARRRSSGQQTEAMPRPAQMLAHGGHLTVLIRLLSRNGDLQGPPNSSGSTIRMRIDLPESSALVTAYISAENLESNQNTEQNPSPSTDRET